MNCRATVAASSLAWLTSAPVWQALRKTMSGVVCIWRSSMAVSRVSGPINTPLLSSLPGSCGVPCAAMCTMRYSWANSALSTATVLTRLSRSCRAISRVTGTV